MTTTHNAGKKLHSEKNNELEERSLEIYKAKDRILLVAYGSETGTACDVAERIWRESFKFYFNSTVLPMNEVSLELLLKSNLILFVASTTGQGDEPENMKAFFKRLWNLRSNRKLLQNLKYAVLGLGDSSYQKYNFAAKRLNNLLSYLGGFQIVKIGLADDQHDQGPDFVINSWLKNVWEVLLNDLYSLAPGVEPILETKLLPSKYRVVFVDDQKGADDSNIKDSISSGSNDSESIVYSSLSNNLCRTSPDHFQDVRLLEFNLNQASQNYKPGDVLVLQPRNFENNVNSFLETLALEDSRKFILVPRSSNWKLPPSHILPQPCTIKQCVESYFDIQAVPRRSFFELLSFFTTDEQEKEKFIEFASAEGLEDLYNYCVRPKRSILEVLADFPFTQRNIPFEYLFDLIPPIYPRSYSICSSSLTCPGSVQILVAVVNYKTILKEPRLGLCSNWLANLTVGSILPVAIKSGSIKFPSPSSNDPIIMIGPGTGCAPFRAFIQECLMSESGKSLNMIFGCRNRDKDYFFKDEWEEFFAANKMKLFCAFSRDQEEKVYVQHIMKQNADYLWTLIGKLNAQIFYAGNAKRIPIDVLDALEFICKVGGCMSQEEANQYIEKNLKKRYHVECWA